MVSHAAYIGAQFIPDTISGIVDCFRSMQEEKTKRQAIAAHRDVLTARITAEKEAILAYFDYRFAERRAVLDKFFELLHHAVDSKDDHLLNVALSGILGVIQDNPLDDFETFRRQFHDPDYVIEIERRVSAIAVPTKKTANLSTPNDDNRIIGKWRCEGCGTSTTLYSMGDGNLRCRGCIERNASEIEGPMKPTLNWSHANENNRIIGKWRCEGCGTRTTLYKMGDGNLRCGNCGS